MPEPEAAALALHRETASPVIVTLGAEGALLLDGDVCQRFPAQRVKAVDATGAGDAFNGELAAALARGVELAQAVPRAVAAATRSVQRRGARATTGQGASGLAVRDSERD